ncbi:hypothetical protein BIV25_42920 [Streptomyces sp. MUSC 14]|nr:hypothetical protein BIV25_42920 [Streptomyces sp. MUSC 14]
MHSVRGVEGVASSGWALEQGDSGGLVFSVASSTARQARGLVSASNSDTDHSTIYWTEAPDILSTLGVSMQNVT